jgi:hypothetical protein
LKTKIIVIILIAIIFLGCNATKRVDDGKYLLYETEINVNDKEEKSEEFFNVLVQRPNSKIFNLPVKLYIYNWAKPKSDSLFQDKLTKDKDKYERWKKLLSAKQVEVYSQSFLKKGIHDFLRNNGNEPVIFDENKTKNSAKKLKSYLNNIGYPKAEVTYKIDTISIKKIKTTFFIQKKAQYTLDSLTHQITSPQLDSMYRAILKNSFLKKK